MDDLGAPRESIKALEVRLTNLAAQIVAKRQTLASLEEAERASRMQSDLPDDERRDQSEKFQASIRAAERAIEKMEDEEHYLKQDLKELRRELAVTK